MARTAVPYSALVANSDLADPSGTALDATNHHVVNAAEPEKTVLRITNTSGASKVVTVKAGPNPPAVAGGLGNLSVTVANGATRWVGPFESGRFLQTDGTMQVDLAAGHTGAITAFKVPRNT